MNRDPSFPEKLSTICIIIASIYLIYSSYQPLMDVLAGREFEIREVVMNLAILSIGVGALWSGINLARRTIALEQLVDTGFEAGIYSRLEPILEEIAGTQVMIERLDERLENMNANVNRLRKRSTELRISGSEAYGVDIPAEVSRFLRIVLLVNITLAAFIFLLNFTRAYTPYLLTVLYLIWWLEITYDYNLWQRSSAWVWAFVPILTIPITTMLFNVVYGGGTLLGSMGVGLAVYAAAYFTWAKYRVEESLPFDLERLGERIPAGNRCVSCFKPFRSIFNQNRYLIGRSLIIISFILVLLFILQIFSAKYDFKGFPEYSLDYLVLTGILSILSYVVGIKLRSVVG
ncbi:hypothetical protein B6V01_001635 [Methanosarcinales archaeon ex4572_44]|nr:MAG: hypothetical protein B6U67_01455 [Methanosarcinales archaeon ex4484_138]PHP45919.1 MAG: hypothetical protein B6V01_001635 [Methanosarcinales archaeon ex4572_44]RLG27058.1 MAG: hypothetical protein DRN85_01245 [Methanosarcinales archaeon]RLG28533.1 MAG: hypothetical protein DRN70_00370 [Methanosarcinales archaeon]HHI30376.1 hypothetical protein [Candidatus Methanoperedenaceae archaeon]